ncbi:uncharacterized protein LOC116339696 [Contarinia nasturtii]|uniref:uncharacterized protein LOC116339696 n=1 Tax=Contarinia nasturtii TaxID=265458 RepID=UPI0012D3D28B|nr:uncharacterized protein LOC116339696 [Contarinia nasturtii]
MILLAYTALAYPLSLPENIKDMEQQEFAKNMDLQEEKYPPLPYALEQESQLIPRQFMINVKPNNGINEMNNIFQEQLDVDKKYASPFIFLKRYPMTTCHFKICNMGK